MRTNRIAFLLAVIAIAAIGFAAFRSAGQPWALHAASFLMFLVMVTASVGSAKSGRWRYFVFLLAFFAPQALGWPIGNFSPRPNWLEARIDGLFYAIDEEEKPPPAPLRRISDRKPLSAMTPEEREAEMSALIENLEAKNAWSLARDGRAQIARQIAQSWFALALGGLAAFATSLLLVRPGRYDSEGQGVQSEPAGD